jgi:maltooligosyltrehalose trehalohydrolase
MSAATTGPTSDPLTPSVWSPEATSMDLVLAASGTRIPMAAADDGWWIAPDRLAVGTDYLFSRDARDPAPDPRSAHQPDGVHGPSRIFDPRDFTWSDDAFEGVGLRGSVIYEMHVGTFTVAGTLDAAAAHLGDLRDLGVTMIELMPLAAFPGTNGWGYDGVALYAVHDAYGGPAALQRFVDAAHGHGLGVCLDVVYNHLGPDGNYLGYYGDYFTDRHHTPWGLGLNADGPGSHEVREFVIGNALRWMRDFRIDALRLDAVHEIRDDSPTHLLAELADRVHALGAELGLPRTLVAESDLNDDRMVTDTASGGRGMDAQWDDDVHHAVHAWATGERQGYYVDFGPGEVLAKALTSVFVHDGGFSTFRHTDWGRPVAASRGADQFVVFAQNHDQVGNRATGDRPSVSLPDATLIAEAALVLLSGFTPMLFMGEEWGSTTPFMYFTDHVDLALGQAVSDGRRSEFADFGWAKEDVPDPQDPATRDRSVLDRAEAHSARGRRIRDAYRSLIALRAAEPTLATPERSPTSVAPDDDAGWVRMTRGGVVVVVSRADGPVEVPLGEDGPGADGEMLFAWDPESSVAGGVVRLPGPGAVVVRR